MKNLLFAAAICLFFSDFIFAEPDTTESSIENVTVYRSGARINRDATITVPAGQSEIVFSNLTTQIQAQSLQVELPDGIDLITAQYRTTYLKKADQSEKVKSIETEIEMLTDETKWNKEQIAIYSSEEQILTQKQIKLSSDTKGLTIQDLKEYTVFFRERSLEIKSLRRELEKKNKPLLARLSLLRSELNTMQSKRGKQTGEVVLSVQSSIPQECQMSFSYLTKNAGWDPIYDLKAKDTSSPMDLKLKANIFQTTGIEWEKVNMAISTGNPMQRNERPILYPKYAHFAPLAQQYYQSSHTNRSKETSQLNSAFEMEKRKDYASKNANGAPGAQGPTGPRGTNGANGAPASNGISCYDTNANGLCDGGEDVNGDGICNAFDCQGPTGATGATGLTGAPGPQGTNGANGSNGVSCWDTNGNGACDYNEDINSDGNCDATDCQGQSNFSKRYTQLTSVSDTEITREYEITLPQTIPSTGQKRLVELQRYEIATEYVHHSVPKVDRGAFLLAKVENWGKYNLLPGTANLFFQNTYIGQSEINSNVTTAKILLSLGRDESLKIKRDRSVTLEEKSFLGFSIIQNAEYTINVKNNKNKTVQLEVLDQIPISQHEDIEISLGEKSGAKFDEKTGGLKWDLELAPGESRELVFSYQQKSPHDQPVSMR